MKRKQRENQFAENHNEVQFEVCILCGKLTNIPKETPVFARQGYVEGAGQLCKECLYKTKEKA
ncbi:hypothetical protein [Eubacterium callanderi]|uniref:hypothetical protein n=1 Tax=Eubacterium callanderi TaxID=53442 RepID=UPI0039997E5C